MQIFETPAFQDPDIKVGMPIHHTSTILSQKYPTQKTKAEHWITTNENFTQDTPYVFRFFAPSHPKKARDLRKLS